MVDWKETVVKGTFKAQRKEAAGRRKLTNEGFTICTTQVALLFEK